MSAAAIRESLVHIREMRAALVEQQNAFAREVETTLARLRRERTGATEAEASRIDNAIRILQEYRERLEAQRVEAVRRVQSINRKIVTRNAARTRRNRRKTRRNNH
jgi:hypothetical protein